MKRVFCFAILLVLLILPVFADYGLPRVVDDAGLLNESERVRLEDKLDKLSREHKMDFVVVTTNSLGWRSPQEYAEHFFDSRAYGVGKSRAGVLILLSMRDRDWYILANGDGYKAVNDDAMKKIEDEVIEYFSDGKYYRGFVKFAELCDDFADSWESGSPYRTPFNWLLALAISAGLGLVAGGVTVAVLKAPMRSVRYQSAAQSYMKPGSLVMSESRDSYLYKTVSRRARPKESSSSHSSSSRSSGGSRGGRGGKF